MGGEPAQQPPVEHKLKAQFDESKCCDQHSGDKFRLDFAANDATCPVCARLVERMALFLIQLGKGQLA